MLTPALGLHSIKAAVSQAAERLQATDTLTPRLDAEVLMGFVLGWERSQLYAHWDEELSREAAERFEGLVRRRQAQEPVAYIRRRKEFLGLEFYVDERVLIPRPETELLVTRAVAWLRQHPVARVVDVGTGSGAIAVGILKECPEVELFATDVSPDAIAVAQLNAQRHGVRPKFLLGSLLEPIEEPVDLVVANLPYLSRDEYVSLQDTSIRYEPRQALTDMADGLAAFRQLFAQIPDKLARPGCLLLEIGADQPQPLLELAGQRLPEFAAGVFADYAGKPRVLQLEW